MALLDQLSNLSADQTQGLLGMAAALLQAGGPSRIPTSFGQALGAGLQGYQQGVSEAEERRARREQQGLQSKLLGLRLQEEEAQSADRQRARQLDAGIRDAALASYQSPVQAALIGGGGPTQENAAGLAASPNGSFDEQGFLSRVSALDPMRALELQRALAKQGPEFDTKINFLNGPDGRPVPVLIGKGGQVKTLDGFTPREKKEFLNLGGREVAVDPYAVSAGQSFSRTASPDSLVSAATARRGQDLSFQNSALDRTQRAQTEKAPTEFQGKSAAFGLRAEEADKILSSLQGKYSPAAINSKMAVQETPLIGGALGAVTNFALSDADQQAEQAQRDFVNANLRQESGAAIGAQEFDNARKQYFPQPGDSTAVIQQKARNRQLAIQGLNSNAGRARISAPAAPGGWSIQRVGE